jgi:3-oxoacyl-[acyl-carrier-protein] synthase-3
VGLAIKSIAFTLGDREESDTDLSAEHPDWDMAAIAAKTGVTKRFRSLSSSGTALDLAYAAAQQVLTGHSSARIDAVVAITSTAELAFPGIACQLQYRLGLPNSVLAYDINLGCSGFTYGWITLSALATAGIAKEPLLVCSDTYTRFISSSDRGTRPIFSDAAAAICFEISDRMTIVDRDFGTDGSGAADLMLRGGASRASLGDPMLHMNGSKVLMFTMSRVPASVRKVLQRQNLSVADIDLFVFHQASQVVLDNLQRVLDIPADRLYRNIGEFGNTVSCTIPIALKQLIDSDRLKSGMRVVLSGFGVGLSWATCLIKIA